MKKKLLSPVELKELRLQQEEQRKLRAEQEKLEKNNKRLVSPKDLLDPEPVVEVKEEPQVVAEEPKDPIKLLSDRLEEVAATIKEPKYYDEELAQLEVLLSTKVNFDEYDLEPLNQKIQELREYISELPEVKYYDIDLDKLTERVDQLQVSGSENFQQHDENLKEIKEVIHQMLEDLVELDKREIPEAFDPTDIKTDIATTKESFYERVDELKKELSELPEVKYYDDELTQLQEKIESVRDSIPEIPEIKYYEDDLENLLSLIEEVRGNVSQLPEVKYYESEIAQLEEAIKNVEDRIPTVPEVRYYEDDIESLREEIKDVEQQIPELPEIPEIKYYDEEVEVLSEDINKVRNSLTDIKLAIKAVEKTVKVVEGREIPEAFDPTGLEIEIEKAFREIEKLKDQPITVNEDTDPLVPLDQQFVTFDELSKHYRTFINRVQQQLSSLGGGGEVRLEFLDDIDRSTALVDGKFLKYQASTKTFVGADASGGGGGSTAGIDTTGTSHFKHLNITGITTGLNVSGVVTASSFVGDVTGDVTGNADTATLATNAQGLTGTPNITVGIITAASAEFSGNVTIGGTITYEDVTNVDSLGIVTARTGVDVLAGGIDVIGISTISTGIGTVNIGSGNTTLLVDGNARITGILTIGTASVTIDGDNNTVSVGVVTITNSEVILGDNVTINSSATGINSAPNVLYVAKDGDDDNNGTSIDNAKLTIASAVGIAQSGTVIKVLSGNYVESNPIELPAFTAIVGDDLRTVKVLPNTPTSDLFHVNKACKLANMTFSGHVHPAAAVAFPTGIATNVGGGKWKGPYIQNCTSDTTTGTGIRIDGNLAEKTKSMNVDAFTQYNQGGVGVAVTNEGYAQLVSVFTICCDEAITAHKGGQADVANSNCSFGTFGLVADGVGPEQFTGIVTSSGASGQDNVVVNVGAITTRPYDGQVVYFDQLYKSVETITVTNGGDGYISAPSVTISSPSGPNGEAAKASATIENGSVTEINIISSGSQYTGTATVTISAPDSGTTAEATANMADSYYTINSSTPITAGITTLTLAENLLYTVGAASTAYFFQQSKIIASSHTFEYIGSGNTITLATPKRGGVTIQANEVVSQYGGRVIYTSTDQAGNFRIGDDLQINQATGTISGRAFTKSLISEMTPYILSLGAL